MRAGGSAARALTEGTARSPTVAPSAVWQLAHCCCETIAGDGGPHMKPPRGPPGAGPPRGGPDGCCAVTIAHSSNVPTTRHATRLFVIPVTCLRCESAAAWRLPRPLRLAEC